MNIYLLAAIAFLVIAIAVYFYYKKKIKDQFISRFNIISMKYFNLSHKIKEYPQLEAQWMELHHKLDLVHTMKPLDGLEELDKISRELDQLLLSVQVKQGK